MAGLKKNIYRKVPKLSIKGSIIVYTCLQNISLPFPMLNEEQKLHVIYLEWTVGNCMVISTILFQLAKW